MDFLTTASPASMYQSVCTCLVRNGIKEGIQELRNEGVTRALNLKNSTLELQKGKGTAKCSD